MSEPAWISRMEKTRDKPAAMQTGYHCSAFEAHAIAKEWRATQAELERLRAELETSRLELLNLRNKFAILTLVLKDDKDGPKRYKDDKDGPKRYYWKQCYELDNGTHWALCDTESDKFGRVSDLYLVLHCHYPTCIDGQPLSEQELPKRIVDLLNGDERLDR